MRREVPLVGDPADAAQTNPGIQRETREQIAQAFQGLNPKMRVVAMLALVEDVAHRDIAEALGISEVAVRVRLFRATKILRKFLRERGLHP